VLKVYISSTLVDLIEERKELKSWLSSAGHAPVESYTADPTPVVDSCLADLSGCSVFVLLIGDRYGECPGRDNPEGLSLIHLEYRAAQELRIPSLIFIRTSSPDKSLSDLNDPLKKAGFDRLLSEIPNDVRSSKFKDIGSLVAGFSAALQRHVDTLSENKKAAVVPSQLSEEDISRAVRRSAADHQESGFQIGQANFLLCRNRLHTYCCTLVLLTQDYEKHSSLVLKLVKLRESPVLLGWAGLERHSPRSELRGI
jgi:Domain of unknown function (DUF4062)